MEDNRYRRQIAFAPIGDAGQRRLSESRVAICGMGALGSMIAERLCRMGVGQLRMIDRDWVELDNLPRQALYTTADADNVRPKSIAARDHLAAINSHIVLEPIVEDMTYLNAVDRLSGVDCIMDGTDNFETRYLINDVSLKLGIPWVHAGIVGASGQCMAFMPGQTACFRCLLPEPPPAEHMQTCDSAGVLGAAVGVIASWQCVEAIKILLGSKDSADGHLRVFELWDGIVRKIRVPQNVGLKGPGEETTIGTGCRACINKVYDFLSGNLGTQSCVLCGRGAVQIQTQCRERIDLSVLASRLRENGDVFESPFLIRFEVAPYQVTVFPDGRAIVSGTENPDEARKIYARWIGG